MKTLFQKRLTHYMLVAAIAALATYAFFGQTPETEAEIIGTVGTFSMSLMPNPSSLGTEYVELSYLGVGSIALGDFTFSNELGEVYRFTSGELSSGGKVRVCADTTKDNACDDEWSGGAVWNNASDMIVVTNDEGSELISHSYSNPPVGGLIDKDTSINEVILTERDAVVVCHTGNGVKYNSPNGNVKGIVTEKAHTSHEFDIIPSFFYNIGGGVQFYEGQNWPDVTDIYKIECAK